MLSGRFGDTSGRPYLEARLFLPRLGADGVLSLLVDTGADETFLMPADGSALGVDYTRLEGRNVAASGAGGPIASFREPAWVVFTDGDELFGYFITLGMLEPRPDVPALPSLLGRDILHRWTMTYQYSRGGYCSMWIRPTSSSPLKSHSVSPSSSLTSESCSPAP